MLWHVVKIVVLCSRFQARVRIGRFIDLRVKRSERKANHCLPSSDEDKKMEIYNWLYGVQRENLG